MLAIDADVDVLDITTNSAETRTSTVADAVDETDDELATARGFVIGIALGLVSLSIIGGGLWWAL